MTTVASASSDSDARHRWLLIDTLGPHEPTVVGVGDTSRRATPLAQFIRGSHRSLALDAVKLACATKDNETFSSGKRTVSTVPILDHRGRTRAVWLLINPAGAQPPLTPGAHAFEWNLTLGTAVTLAAPRMSNRRTVADAMEPHDLGADAATTLGRLISARPGTSFQLTTVKAEADGRHRRINVTGHIRASVEEGRTFCGLSHDLGPAQLSPERPAANLSDSIIKSLVRKDEYLAIVNPHSMTLLAWHTSAPVGLVWRTADAEPRPVIHPDDIRSARTLVTMTLGPPSTDHARPRALIRLLHQNHRYEKYEVVASPLLLGLNTRATLVTLRRLSR